VFSDYQSGEELRTLLEVEYGFFVANRFDEAISCGLHFDESDRIAENVIRMLIEMMISNSETYGNAWFLRLLDEVERHFASDDSRSQVPNNGISETLSSKTKTHVYRRLSQIVLAMLEKGDTLADRVDVTFRELTSARLLATALELIKGLRVSPDLREFDWLRNVIDQSDRATGAAAYLYLYNELKKMNVGAYELLAKLQSWLPAEDREPSSYSQSNRAALRLVIEFSLETTARIPTDQYGASPIRHPLLAPQGDIASKRFDLLAYWLFHPGVDQVFFTINSQENATHVRGALIAEWAFIIVGPPHTSAVSGFAARDLLGLLLRQIIANTSSELRKQSQRDLLAYWEDYKEFLLTFSNVFNYLDPAQRRELNWKRNVLKEMIASFRALQKQL
jgi:hypothetical protein